MFSFKNIIRFCLLLIVVNLLACREAIDWDLKPGENGRLVVEAILTNELTFQEIKLSKSYDGLNEEPPTVDDAIASIEVNGFTVRFFPESGNNGCYLSEVPFRVLNNLEYTLHIEWQGEQYEARSFLSRVAPIPQFSFQPAGTNGNLSFGFVPSIYNPNQQAMYEVDIDWSHLSSDSITKAKVIFYTFSTLEESELVRPEYEEIIFPVGSIVIVKKYGLNDDFADYLRSLAIETNWNGGAFYSAPSSLLSNISNDALGFFSTCAVRTDTLIAE